MRMRRPVLASVVVATALGGGLWVTFAQPQQQSLADDPLLQNSVVIDSKLRAAARLAATPGLKDGSLEWLPQQHLIRSSGGSVRSSAFTDVQFDFANQQFCISASNGHRITNMNASADVEDRPCLLLSGHQPPPNASLPKPAGGMTSRELLMAAYLARAEIAYLDGATIRSITVSADDAGIEGSNTGYACTGLRILHIRLIGDLRDIVVSPAQSDPDPTPRAVTIDADGKTGLACNIGVMTGDVRPATGAVTLRLA